jgi:hypothetical protein
LGLSADLKLLAYENESDDVESLPNALKEFEKGPVCLIVIGPEGGFSPRRSGKKRKKNGFTFVSLGPSDLRAETAAIYAASVFSLCPGKREETPMSFFDELETHQRTTPFASSSEALFYNDNAYLLNGVEQWAMFLKPLDSFLTIRANILIRGLLNKGTDRKTLSEAR